MHFASSNLLNPALKCYGKLNCLVCSILYTQAPLWIKWKYVQYYLEKQYNNVYILKLFGLKMSKEYAGQAQVHVDSFGERH